MVVVFIVAAAGMDLDLELVLPLHRWRVRDPPHMRRLSFEEGEWLGLNLAGEQHCGCEAKLVAWVCLCGESWS